MRTSDPLSAPVLPRRSFLGRMLVAIGGASLLGLPKRSEAATDGINPYIGEIMLWAGNFAPKSWALCNGQLLSISQNVALYQILGTTYGGNGVTTFALPDLRGRVPIHVGQGPGLANHVLGEKAGEESHLLTVNQLPSHVHTARGSGAAGVSETPAGMVPARNAAQVPQYGPLADTQLAAAAISATGGNQPHLNLQPYLVLNYVIALAGTFPTA